MRIGLTLLLVTAAAITAGCAGHDDTASRRAQEGCYAKDKRESERLAREIGPLLAPHAKSPPGEGSACDSVTTGGARVSFALDPDVPFSAVLARFHSAGWADLPQPIEPCGDLCVAGVSKKVGDRRVEATVREFDDGTRSLEALFTD